MEKSFSKVYGKIESLGIQEHSKFKQNTDN